MYKKITFLMTVVAFSANAYNNTHDNEKIQLQLIETDDGNNENKLPQSIEFNSENGKKVTIAIDKEDSKEEGQEEEKQTIKGLAELGGFSGIEESPKSGSKISKK